MSVGVLPEFLVSSKIPGKLPGDPDGDGRDLRANLVRQMGVPVNDIGVLQDLLHASGGVVSASLSSMTDQDDFVLNLGEEFVTEAVAECGVHEHNVAVPESGKNKMNVDCLLYTSDAADE